MNPGYDAAGRCVNQHVSTADESFLESGGGDINMMGPEFAWSPSQRYQMISKTSDPIILSNFYCGGCCEYFYQANDQATGKPAQVLRGI